MLGLAADGAVPHCGQCFICLRLLSLFPKPFYQGPVVAVLVGTPN